MDTLATISATRHQFNQDFMAAAIWYIPLLAIGVYLGLAPFLKKRHVGSTSLYKFASVFMLIAGSFVGMALVGAWIGFGQCYGENCNPTTQTLYVFGPAIVSLLFSVPLARRRFQIPEPTAPVPPNKLLVAIGIVILVWSSIVYLPALVSATKTYVQADKEDCVKYTYDRNGKPLFWTKC